MTNSREKIDRINGIRDEVGEFHPLLRILFSRLPNVTKVEYTHGPNEMGADFVITKKDDTLDDFEYIGVIVKVGVIKQDHADVDKQIDECEVSRTVDGGTRNVFLSEIWVVSNNSITSNAQTKIHNKYKNKNIKFINGEKILDLVDKYYKEYWVDVSVQVGQYFRDVHRKADLISSNSILPSLGTSNLYINQDLVINELSNLPKKGYKARKFKEKRVSIHNALKSSRFIFIEAMMGTGKSTLLAKLASYYASNESFSETNTIPILLTVKEFIEDWSSDICKLVVEICKISATDIHNVNIIILLDGFDELKTDNDFRAGLLKTIHDSCIPNGLTSVIITSRSLDDPELEQKIAKNFTRYRLCQFTIKQVIGLVDNICKNSTIRERLVKDLEKSHLFKVLPKTPFSAILLAKLLNENVQEIPSTMTELYTKYMELVMGRWDMTKGLQSQNEYDVINNVTINIARYIIDNSLTHIAITEARDIYNEYFDSRNLTVEKESTFDKLIRKNDVFIIYPYNRTISFRHRTFAEYFYACSLTRDMSASITEEIYDVYWATSYFFYFGLKRDCPDLIEAVNKVSIITDSTRLLRIFYNGSFLLASYLTPYNVITEAVKLSIRDASVLYDDIVSKKIDSPLQAFSQVQLLCIIIRLLINSFGYEYFKPALEEYATDLFSDPNLDKNDTGLIELFMTNSILASLSNGKAFDTMITDYKNKIPFTLQIAIIVENSTPNGVRSRVITRYVKKIQKDIKSNLQLRQGVIDLCEKPIDQYKEITNGRQ